MLYYNLICTASTGISSVLRKASASVISNPLCQSYFGTTYVTSGTICTGFAGTGTCNVIPIFKINLMN